MERADGNEPDAEQKRWMPYLELRERSGQVLVEPGAELAHAYFPVTSIVSLLYVTTGFACTRRGC